MDQPSQGSHKEFPFPATSLGNSLTASYLTSHQLKSFFPGKCEQFSSPLDNNYHAITLIQLARPYSKFDKCSFPLCFLGRTGCVEKWFSFLPTWSAHPHGCCSGYFTAKFIHRKERGKSKSNKLRRSAPKGCGFLEGWVGSGEEGRCLDSILLL